MAKSTKNGQAKTNGTRTIHVAVPSPLLNKLKRLAKEQKRSINFKAGELLEKAIMSEIARSSRAEYEANKNNSTSKEL